MAAPTTAARVKKTLANPEPSTHGPTLPTWARLQQVVTYLRYIGREANVVAKAAHGRVEMWRGGFRLNISVCRPFRLAVP